MNAFNMDVKPKPHIITQYPMMMEKVGLVRAIRAMRYKAIHYISLL